MEIATKRTFVIMSTVMLICSTFSVFSMAIVPASTTTSSDYVVFSQFDPGVGYIWACGGYVEYYGVPEWGDEIQYIYFISGTTGYKYKVWVTNEGSPSDPTPYIDIRQHPNSPYPDHVGPIEPRHFEYVSSANLAPYSANLDVEEFYVDSTGVYLGPNVGIHKWDHDWNYLGQIGPAFGGGFTCQSLAYNAKDNIWYTGTYDRKIYQLSDTDGDGDLMDETWQYIFTYPSYGGGHHDGMEYVGGYLWISDMTVSVIGKWQYDESTNTWTEVGRYTYPYVHYIEGMGFGPNDHFWMTSGFPGGGGTIFYEVGDEITMYYPIADAGEDVPAHPPTIPVKFDGSGSHHTDPSRKIVLYEWDFDGDGVYDYSSSDPFAEHAYPAYYNPDGSIDWDATAKAYTIYLRVTDDDPVTPKTDVDTCVVHITAPPWKPVSDPDGPYEGYVGLPVQLDGSKSYDPESKMFPEDHPWYETIATYEWDLDYDGEFDDATGPNPTHTWSNEGLYIIGLKVTDSQPSGPGSTIGPLDVDKKYTTVVIKPAKVVNLGIVPVNTADESITLFSDGFDYPVGIPQSQGGTGYVTEANDGDGYYNAQDFGDWNTDYGGYHLGEDWNGEGGGDTDFGDAVYAVSNGEVVYADDAGKGWGNVIIINHRLPDGSEVQSMYAHLRYDSMLVSTGDTVKRGEKIAEIGKGYQDAEYWAHLHFEIRFPDCEYWNKPGPGYSLDTIGWTDPSDFIDTHRELPSYFYEIGEKVTDYYLEVSYGSLYVNVEVYRDQDGSWFTLPQSTAWYSTKDSDVFIKHAIDVCDSSVDFKKHDYADESGKGIITFVSPSDIWGRGAFIAKNRGPDGTYDTDDDTNVDAIYVPEPRFRDKDKVIRGLAHEFAHALGKILVTSVSGSSKDCWWFLPDLYLRGNVDKHWDLMGALRSQYNIEHVHLSSYSKEWLGWLKYKDTRKGETYTITSLTSMKYGDEILRYTYRKPWWEAAPHFYIMELRTNSEDYSDWDIETLHQHALAFYQVDLKVDFPGCRPDTIDLSRVLTTAPDSFSDPDIGVTFKLNSISEQRAEISIEKYKASKLKGASITTSADILSLTMPTLPHEIVMPIHLPDIDLHAYSEEGKHVWESAPITEQINPGETIWHIPVITENLDGTYTVEISPITWEHIFEDPRRQTVLKISTDDKYFQFIAPDKEFLVKHDPNMNVLKRAIIIHYKDWEIKVFAIAINTKLDFCVAIAWDGQTRTRYFLIDKVGIEE